MYKRQALNGIINIRTARPGLTPQTRFSAYVGIYDDPDNSDYQWSDKSFWKEDVYKRQMLYFPLKVNLFEEIAVELGEARFGLKGTAAVMKLLCKIHKENGYYLKWNAEQCTCLLYTSYSLI